MSLATSPAYLLLVLLSIGCSNAPSDQLHDDNAAHSTHQEKKMAQENQTLTRSGSMFCEITSDGEVWIEGDMKGSIEQDGSIWVAGNQEGSLESNGEVWRSGDQIGSLTKALAIWLDGDMIGEIADDGSVWRNGNSIGSTTGGSPRRAAIVFFFGFFDA